MNVYFTPGALVQLDEILSYIVNADPSAAQRVAERIDTLVGLLARRPGIGRTIPNSTSRVVSVRPYPYVIFFRVNEQRDRIEIIRIRHTSRRPLRRP